MQLRSADEGGAFFRRLCFHTGRLCFHTGEADALAGCSYGLLLVRQMWSRVSTQQLGGHEGARSSLWMTTGWPARRSFTWTPREEEKLRREKDALGQTLGSSLFLRRDLTCNNVASSHQCSWSLFLRVLFSSFCVRFCSLHCFRGRLGYFASLLLGPLQGTPATMNLLESLSRRVQLVARPLTLYQPTKQRMRTLGNREKRRTFARKSAGCYSRACYFPIQILQPAFLGSPSLFPLLHPRWRTSTRASLRTSESSPSSLTSSADSSVSPPGSSHRLNCPNSLNHLFRQQGRFVPSPTPRLGSRRCQHG